MCRKPVTQEGTLLCYPEPALVSDWPESRFILIELLSEGAERKEEVFSSWKLGPGRVLGAITCGAVSVGSSVTAVLLSREPHPDRLSQVLS